MEAATSGAEVFAHMFRLGVAKPKTATQCLNFTAMTQAPQNPNPSVGLGWSYMACTEVIHPIAGNNKTDMFPAYSWDVASLTEQCFASWNVHPDGAYLKHNLDIPTLGFGADVKVQRSKALPGKILFTWGEYDPWGTMVPKEGWADDVKVIRVPGGSHCSDLETRRPDDTAGMLEARRQIRSQLSDWIEEVRHLRIMKVNDFGKGKKQDVIFGKTVKQPIGLRKFGEAVRPDDAEGKSAKLRGAKAAKAD